MTQAGVPRTGKLGVWSLGAVWLALLALLAASYAISHIPLGTGNLIAGLGIAAVKVVLVAIFFMRLNDSAPLIRLAAVAALLWLALLFALTFADILIRY